MANHAASCSSCREVISALLGMQSTSGTTPRARDAAQLAPGAHVDRYVIEERLGAGGMGVVYAARDPELGRRVAVKLVRPGADEERLRREAQALARLSHPNVVAVHDVGTHDDQIFVAMALVEGANLRQWLRTPRTIVEILRHLVDAGRGLAAAHDAGLIHRDLKPDNIFVSDAGQALVGDFGLARTRGQHEHEPTAISDDPLVVDLTMTGTVLGTPAYMAPEQRDGEPTEASDQFGFCVTAWEALYGTRPYLGTTIAEIEATVRAGRITPPARDPGVPAGVHRALVRGLSPDPTARFPSMDALLDAMTVRKRRWPWVAGASTVAVAGAAAMMMMMGRDGGARAAACTTTPSTLDEVWSPARRAELERTLTERTPEATADVARVLATVDRHAERWKSMRQEVCATTAANRADLLSSRLACLDQRALELDATLDVVTATAGANPRDAWYTVDQLRAVDRCAHAREVAPPPRSPALDEARAALAALTSRADDRWDEVLELRVRTEPLGDPPLLLDALLLEADVALSRAQPVAAEASARRALTLADQLGDDLDRAHAGALLTMALVRLGRVGEAQGQLPQSLTSLERGGSDWEIAVITERARATIARAGGDKDGEIAALKRIFDQQIAHHDRDSRSVLVAAIDLSDAYQHNGNLDEAREVFKLIGGATSGSARDTLEAAIAHAAFSTNQALLAGEFARALEQARIAVAAQAQLDPESRAQAMNYYAVGSVQELAGDWLSARDSFRASANMYLAHPPTVGAETEAGASLEGVAGCELELGHAEAAIAPARHALALARSLGDEDHRQTSTLLLARALVTTAQFEEPIILLDPLLRELDDAERSSPQRRASAAFHLAQALWATGGERERSRARSLVGDAIRDYAAGRDLLAGQPVYVTAVRLFEQRLADAIAWQARHP